MSNYIYNPESGELYHYGVKGMKWGVRKAEKRERRAQKKELKRQYRSAKHEAYAKRGAAYSEADAEYERAMDGKKKALADVETAYARKQKSVDAQYRDEISRHKRAASEAKSRMDFWGEDDRSGFYDMAKVKYEKSLKNAAEAQSRYDAANVANKIARDQAAINVRDLYYDSDRAADATKAAAYAKAGEEFVRDMALARTTYKEAKKNLKIK